MPEVCAALTRAVADFLEGFDSKKLLATIAGRLAQYRGGVSLALLKLSYSNSTYRTYFDADNRWTLITTSLAVSAGQEDPSNFSKEVTKAAGNVGDTVSALELLFCSLIATRANNEVRDKYASKMVGNVLEAFVRLINEASRRRARGGKPPQI